MYVGQSVERDPIFLDPHHTREGGWKLYFFFWVKRHWLIVFTLSMKLGSKLGDIFIDLKTEAFLYTLLIIFFSQKLIVSMIFFLPTKISSYESNFMMHDRMTIYKFNCYCFRYDWNMEMLTSNCF